jgi:hypothetical protein
MKFRNRMIVGVSDEVQGWGIDFLSGLKPGVRVKTCLSVSSPKYETDCPFPGMVMVSFIVIG